MGEDTQAISEEVVHGRGLTDVQRHGVQEFLRRSFESGTHPLITELTKTDDEIKIIHKVNGLLKSKMVSEFGTGFDAEPLDVSEVHILPRSTYIQITGSEGSNIYDALSASILLNVDRIRGANSDELFQTLFRQGVGKLLFHSFVSERAQGGNSINTSLYRRGYEVLNAQDKYVEFRGFNSGVIERIVREICQENGVPFEQTPLGKTQSELLEVVIEGIARKKRVSYEEIWNTIKEGAFNGDMMHLRDIEEVFGKGSLRFLAAINTDEGRANIANDSIKAKVLKFFATDSQSERNTIASSVLDERERYRYTLRVRR